MAQRNPSRPLPEVKNQFRPDSDWIGHISDLVVCPHNSAHVMRSHKLFRHLMVCPKASCGDKEDSRDNLKLCPYNSLHRFPEGKQDEHFRECKARAEDLMARHDAGESIQDVDSRYCGVSKDDEKQ